MLPSASRRAAENVVPDLARYASLNAFISNAKGEIAFESIRGSKAFIKGPIPSYFQQVAVKDNIAVAGSFTTCASGVLQRHRSPFDAAVVQKLKHKGGSILGKTNMDEFGMGSHSTNSFFGPVNNVEPYDQHSAGGSSGGSAVAVATNQCKIALGTDTGGSVRLPAAYTGVVGYKPSYGTISRWGIIPYANSMDTVGMLGPDVETVMSFAQLFRKPDLRDPTSTTKRLRVQIRNDNMCPPDKFTQSRNSRLFKPSRMNIGVPVEYNIEELDPVIRREWNRALTLLEDKGCTIVPISLPNTKHALSAYYVIAGAEAASNLSKYDGVRFGSRSDSADGSGDVLYSKSRGEFFGEEVQRRILLGSYTLSSSAIDNYFIQAQRVRRLVQRDFDRVFSLDNPLRPAQQFDISDMHESIELDNKLGPAQVDFIVCPTAPTLAPTLDAVSKQTPVDTYMNDVFTVPASLAGIPAISVPFEIPKEDQQPGVPPFAGIQIIGQFGDDHHMLLVAHLLESLREGKESKNFGKPNLNGLPKRLKNMGGVRNTDAIAAATLWPRKHQIPEVVGPNDII